MASRTPDERSRFRGRLLRRRQAHEAATSLDAVLPCNLVREAISALFDGEGAPVPEGIVDSHVALCAGCRVFRSGLETLSRQLRVRAFDPTPGYDAAILLSFGGTANTPSMDRDCGRRRRDPARRSLLRATQWAAGIVPLGIAVPALALGAFAHLHIAPSHFPTPCTVPLIHALVHR